MLDLLDVNNKGLHSTMSVFCYLTNGQTNVMCGYVYYLYQISQNIAPAVHYILTIILKPEEDSSLLVCYFVFCSIMVLMFPGSVTVTSEL